MRSFIAALVFCLLVTTARAEGCVASVSAIGDSSQLGTKTASGIPLDDNALTVAHKSVPSGSKVKVINKQNGPRVSITITDRGPYLKGRCNDLTKAGARGLAPARVGSAMTD
jgi:rare lipoprotein A